MKDPKKHVIKKKEKILTGEVEKMLKNPEPLKGIYSIYGDHPIEKWRKREPKFKKINIKRIIK